MRKIFEDHQVNKNSQDSFSTKINKVTSYALYWNFWEACISQILLIGHQTALFFKTSGILFGLQGTFFALLYVIIDFLNMSLEFAIIPYFPYFSASKYHFRKFIYHYIIPQSIIFLTIPLLFIYIQPKFLLFSRITILFSESSLITIIMLICIISEGLKKNARALLYLALKNKVTAFGEIVYTGLYTGTVWGLYILGYQISLPLLALPFCFLSVCTTSVLWYNVYLFYKTLPATSHDVISYSFKKYNKSRFIIFINHTCRIFFSSNFLVPFFAQTKGMLTAGTAHLISSITFGVTYCIQRLFAPTGGALFSHIRNIDHTLSQKLFSNLIKKIIYTISLIVICMTISIVFITLTQDSHWRFFIIPLLITFFISHILESLFMIFEKIFIAYDQPLYSTVCNLISIVICFFLYTLLYKNAFMYFIIGSMIIRIVTFIVLCAIAFKKWGFSFKINNTICSND